MLRLFAQQKEKTLLPDADFKLTRLQGGSIPPQAQPS